jgi:HEPN domain-containing protein
MRKQAKSWMEAASSDLILIEEIQDNELLTHMVAFHSQQAIEKIFKAVLEENEERVPKTHDLTTLSEKINKLLNIGFDYDILDQMNELYIEARYPTDLGLLPNGKPTKEVANQFYKYAKDLYELVEKKYN